LQNAVLSNSNLSGADLKDANLQNAIVLNANLGLTNMNDANLSGSNLSGANLNKANLIGANLIGANLNGANLINANISGANMERINLNGANLTGANLTGANLRMTVMKGIKVIKHTFTSSFDSITSFDINRDVKYITEKKGILYEIKNGDSKIVLNLMEEYPGNNGKFTFFTGGDGGLLSVVSNKDNLYLSYTGEELLKDGSINYYLVVDEFSKNFVKLRNIIKIDNGKSNGHFGGTLAFDRFEKLYIALGDGEN
jgi:Uncharacterized low-complexity proteins